MGVSMRFTLVLLALVALAPSIALADDAGADARYQALLAAAKSGTAPVDWKALRFAYADTSAFDVFGTRLSAARKQAISDYSARDFNGALAQTKLMLDQDFVDPEAHLFAAAAYDRLGQPADAERERAIARGLLDSIGAGDGKTSATAFTVIAVNEEYELMRSMGVKVAQQSLINQGGHAYDLLAGTGPTGAEASYYFLIDRVMAAESAALHLPRPHPPATAPNAP